MHVLTHATVDAMGENRGADEIQLVRNVKTVKLEAGTSDDETRINRELITLVWYDVGTEEVNTLFREDVRLTRTVLRELNDFVQLFSTEAACIEYMEKCTTEIIVLIVSGSNASGTLLEKVHTLRQVATVFIFCNDINKYNLLFEPPLKYPKIDGIFTDQQSLKESIVRTVRLIEKQAAMFSIYNPEKQKSSRHLSGESGSFVWLQLVKEGIQRFRANGSQKTEDLTAKEEMLSRCRIYYHGNAKAMAQIDEFELSYKPDEAISWYTRDSFVYKLINKALRTENVETIYDYRYYIADLCICLAENCGILLDSTAISTLKLYRGAVQTRKEIQRLQDSVGQLISVNTFFSTSRNRSVAEIYAGLDSQKHVSSNLESLIFEIIVELKSNSTCLADVICYSPFKDEEEILIDFATVFEIEAVILDPPTSTWICKMAATDKAKGIAKEYMELTLNEIEKSDISIFFGTLLLQMSEYRKAKDYFSKLIDQSSSNVADILHRLGYAHYGLDEHQEALECFDRARSVYLAKEPLDLANAAKVATHKGNAHTYLCQYDEAIVCHTESLSLYEKAGMMDQVPVVRTLIGLGEVYGLMGKDDFALQYCQQALSRGRKVMPFDHPTLGSAYMYVAKAFYRLGDYDQALIHITNTINIERQVYPSNSAHFGSTLTDMGKYFYKKGKYDQALISSIEACEIFAIKDAEKYPQGYAIACNNIGKIYYRLKDYEKARGFYEKALVCQKALVPNTCLDIAYTLKNQSELCLACNDLETAVVLSNDSRKLFLSALYLSRHFPFLTWLKFMSSFCLNFNIEIEPKYCTYLDVFMWHIKMTKKLSPFFGKH